MLKRKERGEYAAAWKRWKLVQSEFPVNNYLLILVPEAYWEKQTSTTHAPFVRTWAQFISGETKVPIKLSRVVRRLKLLRYIEAQTT